MSREPLFGGALSCALPASRSAGPAIPFRFVDISEFRQVPDHQEVRNDVDSGCSVCVEILGTLEPDEVRFALPATAAGAGASPFWAQAAWHYYCDLAETNGCEIGPAGPAVVTPAAAVQPPGGGGEGSAGDETRQPQRRLPDVRVFSGPVPVTDAEMPNFPLNGCANGTAEGSVTEFKCAIEGTQVVTKFRERDGAENVVYVGLAIVRLAPPAASDLLVSVSAPVWISNKSSEAKVINEQTVMTLEQAQQVLRGVVQSLAVDRWSLFM